MVPAIRFLIKMVLFASVLGQRLARQIRCAPPYQCVDFTKCKSDGQGVVVHRCGADRACCVISDLVQISFPTTSRAGVQPEVSYGESFENREKMMEENAKKALLRTCGYRVSKVDDIFTKELNEGFNDNKVLGGEDAKLGEVPWIVLVNVKEKYTTNNYLQSGGTLISSVYVLTAAHCVGRKVDLSTLIVALGEISLKKSQKCVLNDSDEPSNSVVCRSGKVIQHENYNDTTNNNDIALIRMNESVQFNYFVQPACLPFDELGEKLSTRGNKLLTAGWGRIGKGKKKSQAEILQVAYQSVIPYKKCETHYKSIRYNVSFSKSQVCALGKNNSRTLVGDSGGPLLLEEPLPASIKASHPGQTTVFVVVGANSFGPTNWSRENPPPAVFTRVKNYLGWILRHMKLENY